MIVVGADLLLLQLGDDEALADAVVVVEGKRYQIEAYGAKHTEESQKVMRGVTIPDLFYLEPPRTALHLRQRVEHYKLDVQVKLKEV